MAHIHGVERAKILVYDSKASFLVATINSWVLLAIQLQRVLGKIVSNKTGTFSLKNFFYWAT
jgi:hypothetical protein